MVDDSAANRYLAATILRGAGYEVDAVSSGAEVMPSIAAKTYRAILLDVHLPGMDGFEVAQVVRRFESQQCRPRIPIIALTADTLPETRTRLLAQSIDLVLHKPASENEMLAAIAAISGREMQGAGSGEQGAGGPAPCSERPLARLNGNRALYAELATLFLREAASQRALIEESLEGADGRTIWKNVHRLRGQALMFDAAELCSNLVEIEVHALANRLQSCRERWEEATGRLDFLLQSLAPFRSEIDVNGCEGPEEASVRT